MGKYRCATCGFELHHPIATLSVSALGLYDDARFPGRCILALRPPRDSRQPRGAARSRSE